jgi:hypothetical protein
MQKYTQVKLSNQDKGYTFTLDYTIPYREVLLERVRRLEWFINNNSLEQATSLIQEVLGDRATITPKEVDKALRGARGMLTSHYLSLEGKNNLGPRNLPLTRHEGTPIMTDAEGGEWVRGVVVDGRVPRLRNVTNNLSMIRLIVEAKLELPIYTRWRLQSGDETVDRNPINPIN